MHLYCTVHIALHMFTHVLQITCVSCLFRPDTCIQIYIHMSGLAVGYINTLFTEYKETSLIWCHIVTRVYPLEDQCHKFVTFMSCIVRAGQISRKLFYPIVDT